MTWPTMTWAYWGLAKQTLNVLNLPGELSLSVGARLEVAAL